MKKQTDKGNFRNKKVYVSAGSRGIGFSIALRFAELGADIAISSRKPERLQQAKRKINNRLVERYDRNKVNKILTIEGDLTLHAEQERITKMLKGNDFLPDIFVCNAGYPEKVKIEKVTYSQWNKGIESILTQAVFTAKHFIPNMKQKVFGRIFYISSIHSKIPDILPPDFFIASITRAALLPLTKMIHNQYADSGVTAFTLLLGYMDTPALRNIAMGIDPDNDLSDSKTRIDSKSFPWVPKYNEWEQTIPCKKIGDLNHLADLVEFLSSRAALYLGGSPISFNGGLDKCIL